MFRMFRLHGLTRAVRPLYEEQLECRLLYPPSDPFHIRLLLAGLSDNPSLAGK